MEWVSPLKEIWWLLGVLLAILAALWKLAITSNKSKESLQQVATNKEAIESLKVEMNGIKDDIADIKDGVDKQSEDMAAVLGALQSIMIALNDRNCDIGSARDKFNEYLAHR